MCKATKCHPTNQQLEHAIKRNFGGFDSHFDTYDIFHEYLNQIQVVETTPDQDIVCH